MTCPQIPQKTQRWGPITNWSYKKKVEAHSLIHITWGQEGVLELWDGIRTN